MDVISTNFLTSTILLRNIRNIICFRELIIEFYRNINHVYDLFIKKFQTGSHKLLKTKW